MYTEKAELKHKKMTEMPIVPLMTRFAVPSGIAMIVTALYSLADALFVSELGTDAGAAVGISFAIQATVQAVSYTLGVGAGSLLSRKLGDKDIAAASTYARVSFFWAVLAGLAIMGTGLTWGKGLMTFLGASPAILPLAFSYAKNLLYASPFMCATFVLSQLLRAEGKAVYSMVGLLCGSLLNIVLDPILIYRMNFGISGASLATLISQILSFAVLLSAYLCGQSQLRLLSKIQLSELKESGKILISGLPSSGRQGLMALATILLNHATAAWGNAAVAAMSVVNRVFLLVFAVCLGIGQGMMPVAGYNYGYKRFDRTRQAYRFALLTSSALMLLIEIPILIYAPHLIRLFRDDAEVIRIGAKALRAQSAVFVLHGTVTCTNMLLQAIGKQTPATFLACARQGFFFLPLIWLLPNQFGLPSVIYVQPLADALTFLFAIPFLIYALRHLRTSPLRE